MRTSRRTSGGTNRKVPPQLKQDGGRSEHLFMKTLGICLTMVVIVLAMVAKAIECRRRESPPPPSGKTADVLLGTDMFRLEVAETPPQLSYGLMNRRGLDRNGGMLFILGRERQAGFWMKNTMIPLDIAFVNSCGVVTAIHTMKTEPVRGPFERERIYEKRLPLYGSNAPVAFAIEVNAGTLKTCGLKEGDHVEIRLP